MSIKKELIIQDPVCGTIIKKEEAVTLTLENNKKIYFCSRKCMLIFLKNPDKYVGKVHLHGTYPLV